MATTCSVLMTVLLLAACSNIGAKTTDTQSSAFGTKEGKLDFLRKYLTHMEGVRDAEYHIVFQDNGAGLVPGPTDYSIIVALVVDPDSLVHWTENCVGKDTLVDADPWRKALSGFDWPVTDSALVCRPEPGVEKIIYRNDGVVLAHYRTN